jgi:alpha-mannosidase
MLDMKRIVHMIGNAHIDPVWLWTWPQGVDEALATCRSACDMLDEYPGLHITRGDAWVYWWVQQTDPTLFKRICRHVGGGRWHPVGGWWVQADCNLPTAASFRKQGEIGTTYFREHFGIDVNVGFCLDSFGHCATLPSFLRSAGLDSYVIMRPQPHEKELPVLFTWEAPDGEAVTVFRISRSYTAQTLDNLIQNVEAAIEHAPGITAHTMCFYGVGDHGGGPTREQIEWIRDNRYYADDLELRFSDPATFFSCISDARGSLPVVRDELQHHAIGCYSAVHRMKQSMRRAETLAIQAGHMLAEAGDSHNPEAHNALESVWRHILFNQFHDILAGSSIEEGYTHAYEQLGYAASVARDIIVTETRRRTAHLPPAPRQRLVLYNTSEMRFDSLIEFEPWLGYRPYDRPVQLKGPDGNDIALQRIRPVARVENQIRFLFKASVPPMAETIYEITHEHEIEIATRLRAEDERLYHDTVEVHGSRTGISRLSSQPSGDLLAREGISIAVYEDDSDTWSHGIDRFDGKFCGTFSTEKSWQVIEEGPLRAGIRNILQYDESTLDARVYLYDGEPAVRFRFRFNWHGRHRIVKLLIPPAFHPANRADGIPGGSLKRTCDGKEYPVHNYLMISSGKTSLAMVSADAYSADVQEDGTIRLTLLRSPVYAHHDPFQLNEHHWHPATGQHLHDYEITLIFGADDISEQVKVEVERQKKPVWISETTRGMVNG